MNLNGLDGDTSKTTTRHGAALAEARDLDQQDAEAVEVHLA